MVKNGLFKAMPNFVTAVFCTDVFCHCWILSFSRGLLAVPAQFSTFNLHPRSANTSSKGRKSPVLLSKGLPSLEFLGLNLIPPGFSNSLKYVFSCFNLSCFSDLCVCVWNHRGVLVSFLRNKSSQNVFSNLLEAEF